MTAPLVRRLARLAREAAHPARSGAWTRSACPGCAGDPAPVLADRPDGTVVRHGAAVAKAHAPGTDPAAHRVRLAVAAHPALHGILLPPLPVPATATAAAGDRPLTAWPYGTRVDPADPGAAPWEEAARLLARLHRVDPAVLPGPLPPMRGPAKAAAALARMEAAAGDHPAAEGVRRAWRGLPPRARGEADPRPHRTLCHGDLHLGQLVRHPAEGGDWLLIDVDDLGLGDPTWDLARPAAWFAAGLLPPATWQRFLGAYAEAGGPAVTDPADPWPELDTAARALTVQTAALALAKSVTEGRQLDEVEGEMIDTCTRIGTLAPELDPEGAS
ncbi:aminoglycoside phosphotransferase family protein [Streptomyces sp. NPDC005805]|uniref:phosphotransferase family protein n=1 Tax=Streptomyces sp. NPDC005805 TaxID=3157068 RepID=UPI0033EBF612